MIRIVQKSSIKKVNVTLPKIVPNLLQNTDIVDANILKSKEYVKIFYFNLN